MASTFHLPDLGEGIESAEIVTVLVAPGEAVSEGQSVLVVESDKASIEVPAKFSGQIEKVLVEKGQAVAPGEALFEYAGEGAPPAAAPPTASEPAPAAAAEAAPPPAAEPAPAAAAPAPAAAPPQPDPAKTKAAGASDFESAVPVPASPAVRRYAREFGLDLRTIEGSGLGGRVTLDDVQAAAATASTAGGAQAAPAAQTTSVSSAASPSVASAPAPAPAASVPAAGGAPATTTTTLATGSAGPLNLATPRDQLTQFGPFEVQALTPTRKTIAKRMHQSWTSIPHVLHRVKADITAVEKIRKQNKEYAISQDSHISSLSFILKATVYVLKKYPQFNAEYDVDRQELVLKKYYNLGIAVDSPGGLVVPVIQNADSKSLIELGRETLDLATRAREGKLGLADFAGHSFSVSNLGSIGGESFTPIINAPDVAILGIMRGKVEPVFDGSSFVPRTMVPLCLSYDHRVVDGADAARFMNDLSDLLAQPDRFLLEA